MYSFNRIFTNLVISLLISSLVPVAVVSAGTSTSSAEEPPRKEKQIPAASLPCDPEVANWWESLRASGNESARLRKQKRMDRNLSQGEIARLDREIALVTKRYQDLLHEGFAKSYNIPVPDGPELILFALPARYTEDARRYGVQGMISLNCVLRHDGLIGDVSVIKGLTNDLNYKCIETTQDILFLPEIKNGKFVSKTISVSYQFNIY